MKEKIQVTVHADYPIYQYTSRRRSKTKHKIYYEFKIDHRLIDEADNPKEVEAKFEEICDEYVVELDKRL